jgi:serine/threonine protein phosphatase 1
MGRVFATSDWHGCKEPAMLLMEYLGEDDTLYFLGDAIDRGEHGYELLTMLLSDPRVIFIKGNHEDLMAKGLPEYCKGEERYWCNVWRNNGCANTLKNIPEENLKDMQWVKELVSKLNDLPAEIVYESPEGHKVILDHSGYTPGVKSHDHIDHIDLWDRTHFNDEWKGEDNVYLIHGHTMSQSLTFEYEYNDKVYDPDLAKIGYAWYDPSVQFTPEVINYCGGHKFDIDMGTIISGRIALIDLDTFEVKYFDSDVE